MIYEDFLAILKDLFLVMSLGAKYQMQNDLRNVPVE